MSSKPTGADAVLKDVSKPHDLKKVTTHESAAVAQAKTLMAVEKGTAAKNLHHVDAPSGGLSEAEKKAYLEDRAAEAAAKK